MTISINIVQFIKIQKGSNLLRNTIICNCNKFVLDNFSTLIN